LAYALNSFFIGATLTLQIILMWLLVSLEEPLEVLPKWNLLAGRGVALILAGAALAIIVCERCLWLGDDWIGSENPSQAVRYYRMAQDFAPPWRLKPTMSLIRNDSLADRKKLVLSFPEDPYQWAGLASQAERLGLDIPEISGYWTKALERDPYNPNFHCGFSKWLWRCRDYPKALDEIDESLGIYPEGVDFLFQRALVLHSLGREEEAQAAWQEVLHRKAELAEKRPW
jgi:tetratricopeptide (TPR) repeat protein